MQRTIAVIGLVTIAAVFVLIAARTVRARRLSRLSPQQDQLPSQARLQGEIRKYEELTRTYPRDPEYWHDLGGLYRDAEQWDKAINAEDQAVHIHPKYAVAYWGRGKSKMGRAGTEQGSQASSDYTGAIEDFTSSIKLFELRGGLEVYLTLEQSSDEYTDCYRSRGVALAHLNKYPEGIADLSIALRLRKDDPKLIYERGYLEEKAGLKNDAIPDYHRAGMIFADSHAKASAQECIARLDGLGAKYQADAIRVLLAPKTPKSDLPK